MILYTLWSNIFIIRIIIKISEMETPFGKRIFIKKRKIKEQMKIILAQYFEIFQISSSGKILWQKTLWKNKNLRFLQGCKQVS